MRPRGPAALRAVSSYAAPWVLLLVTTTVLTAGVGLGAAVAAGPGGRAGTVLPLLVLGLVVVPVPAVELGRRRREVVTLARLRGRDGVRLALLVAGPAATAALLGGLLGGLLAAVGAGSLPWTPGAVPARATGLTWSASATALAVVLAGAAALTTTREPLAAALRGPRHPAGRSPSASSAVRPVVLVVLVAASTAAVYLAATDPGSGPLLLAGTGVLALTLAEVATVALSGLRRLVDARAASGATASLATLLGLRRAAGAGAPAGRPRTRAVVAAGILAVAALGSAQAGATWADRSDRVALGAPVQVRVAGLGATEALALTRRLDPDGRWLMAAAVSDDRVEATLRVAWVDLARWRRVAAPFLTPTPAGVDGDQVAALREATPVAVVRGTRLRVGGRPDGGAPVTVTVDYLGADGLASAATATLGRGRRAAPDPVDCAEGCVVLSLTASAPATLTTLDLDGTDLLAAGWAPADPTTDPTTDPSGADRQGLRLGTAPLVPVAATATVPVLTAGDPAWEGATRVPGVAGDDRPALVVGSRAALPLVGTSGLLADLPTALAGAGAQGSSVRTLVLARADTPRTLLDRLERQAGPTEVLTSAGPQRALGPARDGERRARLVLGAAAAALAVLLLLGVPRAERRAGRHDRAVLRLLGLPRGVQRRTAVVEAAVLAAVVGLAVLGGGVVTTLLAGDGPGLVPTGTARLDLGAGLVLPLALLVGAVTAVVTALVVALVVVATRLGGPRGGMDASPASLLTAPGEHP